MFEGGQSSASPAHARNMGYHGWAEGNFLPQAQAQGLTFAFSDLDNADSIGANSLIHQRPMVQGKKELPGDTEEFLSLVRVPALLDAIRAYYSSAYESAAPGPSMLQPGEVPQLRQKLVEFVGTLLGLQASSSSLPQLGIYSAGREVRSQPHLLSGGGHYQS